ncbi:MAG: Cellulose synthase catalytic subunit (UDP-forming) [Syntrophorhabdaceae bacterium PtaU1.Bin034]|jgi:ceramide glucosyltransferase|nr:MAG: Cellulose synthase catalytic subunit (UDP-forming) [Syntrophorhabdaceae bacterium PtaU1.Bin034]
MIVIHILFAALIVSGCLYSLFSLVCVVRFFGKGRTPAAGSPNDAGFSPVSVLKPLKGLEPDGADALLGFCSQDYPRSYEVLFGFRQQDDPAIPLVRKVVESSGCRARLIVNDKGAGANQKILNLESLVSASRHPLLAISDSDMVVDKDYLRTIVTEFAGTGKTGIVTCLYKISNPSSVGSALESYTIALDFIPSVLVARQMEGITFGLGASMLLSREALRDIGGLAPIAEFLADDYQIGFRLWKKGYTNVLSRYVMENRVGSMSIADHVTHQLRWARTYRASRPKGFVGYGITHVFPFAVLFLIFSPGFWSLLSIAVVLALRYSLAAVVYRKVISTGRWLAWLYILPLKDLISFFVWITSFAGSKVFWRGASYRLIRDGRMVRV